LEATGIYSLDLAFALDAAEGIEVAVLNPKVANRFAQTIRRSKTDAADAEVLAEYTHRMPFTGWVAPSANSMRLRSIVRHVESLSVQSAQNQNRLHAAQGSTSTPGCKHHVALTRPRSEAAVFVSMSPMAANWTINPKNERIALTRRRTN
jgi:transposase